MLAELAAANAAFGVIKSFISNGKELASCGKQISDFVFAKEQIEKKAKKQKAKGTKKLNQFGKNPKILKVTSATPNTKNTPPKET